MIILSIGFAAGFITAMTIYERKLLVGWLRAAGTFFINQWQKVTKKG